MGCFSVSVSEYVSSCLSPKFVSFLAVIFVCWHCDEDVCVQWSASSVGLAGIYAIMLKATESLEKKQVTCPHTYTRAVPAHLAQLRMSRQVGTMVFDLTCEPAQALKYGDREDYRKYVQKTPQLIPFMGGDDISGLAASAKVNFLHTPTYQEGRDIQQARPVRLC